MWSIVPTFNQLKFNNPSPRDTREIKYLAIHHTAGPSDQPTESIHKFHLSKGWSGIAYHYLARPYKNEEGLYIMEKVRPVTLSGACVKGFNSLSVCVCLAGDYSKKPPDGDFLRAVKTFSVYLCLALKIPPENVKGHREFPNQATECPGMIDMDEFRRFVGQYVLTRKGVSSV